MTALVLALTPVTAAHPEPVPGPAQRGPVRAGPVGAALVPVVARSAVDPAHRIETSRTTRPVAPGVELTSFDWYEPGHAGGWVRGDALTVDLTAGTRVDYLHPGRVTTAEPLSAQADRARAVAAVNGDFFDIDDSNAPEGVGVQGGTVVKSPSAGHRRAAGVDAAGIGRVMDVLFDGRVTLPDGSTIPVAQLDNAAIEADAVGVFTPVWGSYSRARAVRGAAKVTEVVVRAGVVTEVRPAAGDDPIPVGGQVLVGREAGADRLAGLAAGQRVAVDYTAVADDGSALAAAVGGGQLLLKDGVVVASDDPLHPRTAVGFSADGRKVFLLTVDGRQDPFLLGLSLKDLAAVLREMGAHNALNFDGGGSSTLLARTPGAQSVTVENTPSDGGERPVPNGLALHAPEGSGRLAGFWTRTAIDPRRAPGADAGHPERVFPGLTRRLVADGYDETHGPARDGSHSWHSTRPDVGQVVDGVFHGLAPGTAKAVARRGGTSGEVALTVLGPLSRLTATTPRLSLPEGGSGGFGVVGHDPDGFTAPVEPTDLVLDHDRSVVEVVPGEDGALRVTALKPGTTTVTASVRGTAVRVPVTVGSTAETVADLEDAASWAFDSARGSGSVTPVAEGHTGAGLRLGYDFGRSTATRTACAVPPGPIVVEGRPLALGAWVHGRGLGEGTAFVVTDDAGRTRSLYGPDVTWTGWRYLEVAVPADLAFPLRVGRFCAVETKADRQYAGEVLVDDVVAQVPPDVQLPAAPRVADRIVVRDGALADREWRFAVVSDAHLSAGDPDGDPVRAARRTLREIKAQHPDFLVVGGDFVAGAAPPDLALAHRVLREELGEELPWCYVPGDREIAGPGTIEAFRREFGVTHRVFDHRGTRFVLLDTSTGTVRGGGVDQAAVLRDALRDHAPVGSVVVVQHHPLRDPDPTGRSRLDDRREAGLVEGWLADFRRTTGKGAVVVAAHAGVFHASRVDGVPHLVTGNAGTAPPEGGFTGWTALGVDPQGRDPVAAEIRPHVDDLVLTAPGVVRVGTPGTVAATVVQGPRRVPVAYPVSADWTGSSNVHIGQKSDVQPWHVARFDPETGSLTAVRPGTATIAVTVNGVTRRADVTTAWPQRSRKTA
ncbi:phosphodiester glycosidase family protein [Actinosynnema sp. NPDC050436]|uniref:phosphodiester glycosidase family protein n=1 Tax=Actinosynnema sp. NPDC050436 TaxID=3155659 RepID=UPI0033D313AE